MKYMKYFLLGLLMLKEMTVYQLKTMIAENFSSMCSDSPGSIQAALKKLSQQGAVTYSEYVEKGKMKKEYAITASGRILFLEWLKTPIDMSKNKNMDLGKFLFMGYLPKREQLQMLDLTIEGLEVEVQEFEAVKDAIRFTEEQEKVKAYLEQNSHLATELIETSQAADLAESISQIGYFEIKTLEFGLDSARFQLEWFSKLRQQLAENEKEG